MKPAVVVLWLAVAVVVGALVTIAPLLALVLVLAGAAGAVMVKQQVELPVAAASAFILIVLIPELADAPPTIRVAGASVYIPHLLMVGVVPFVDWSLLTNRYRTLLLGFAGLVVWMAIWGLARGAPPTAVLQDLRGPLTFFGGAVCCLLLYERRGLAFILRLVLIILGATVVLSVMQAATGYQLLGGRVGDAGGLGGSGTAAIDATRFIVSSEDLAIAAFLVAFWWMTQPRYFRPSRNLLMVVAAASALIVVLSLSRQLIVGLAVGALGWLLLRGGVTKAVRMLLASMPFVCAAVLLFAVLTAGGQGLGSDTVIGRQLDGFSERVVNGFDSNSLQQDAGSTWRQRENRLAIEVIKTQPLGTGLGNPYREQLEIEAFGNPTFFRRWVHNVYLWYGTKGGGLGLLAVALITVVPFIDALRRARSKVAQLDPIAEVSVPILLAFGVMSLVDPVIVNSSTGVITASLVVLLGLRTRPTFARSVPDIPRSELPKGRLVL